MVVRVDEIMVLVGQPRQQVPFSVQYAHVRAEDLVGTVQVKIDVQILHVHAPVRRIGDTVDTGQRAGLVDSVNDRFHVMDEADDVRAMSETDQLRPIVQKRFQILDLKIVGIGVHAPFANYRAGGFQPAPRAVVGLVVLVGDDNFVAGLQQWRQRVRQDVDIAGRRRPDDNFVKVGIDQGRQHRATFLDAHLPRVRGFVTFTGLHLAVGREIGKALGDLLRHQRAARVFQKHPAAGQRLEVAAAELYIESWMRCHGAPCSGCFQPIVPC